MSAENHLESLPGNLNNDKFACSKMRARPNKIASSTRPTPTLDTNTDISQKKHCTKIHYEPIFVCVSLSLSVVRVCRSFVTRIARPPQPPLACEHVHPPKRARNNVHARPLRSRTNSTVQNHPQGDEIRRAKHARPFAFLSSYASRAYSRMCFEPEPNRASRPFPPSRVTKTLFR